MSVEVRIVDAFTDEAFRGNPAGVVILREPRDAVWMQKVAAELRHSETAFVVDRGDADDASPLPLRWFTPVAEVDLCGHATLATAHVLGGPRSFATRSGVLRCDTAPGGWVEMDFPADPPAPLAASPEILACLGGAEPVAAAKGRYDILVRLAGAAQVRSLVPDLDALRALPVRGMIVTAPGEEAASIVSRCFYPAVGIPEDPVTGSAHCTLASYWSEVLGVTELSAQQASERGGRIRLRISGDRVFLAGQAVSVFSGHLADD
jgi:predicted PhzF superfamily epimerase YddE/YHI9